MLDTRIPRILLALLLLVGCGSEEIPDLPLGTSPPPATRPSDGLLENPGLQEVVDLQVDRDGAALQGLLASPDPDDSSSGGVRSGVGPRSRGRQDPGWAPERPRGAVRRDAAFALGQLGDPLFGPVLMGALRDETAFEVRFRILEALGKVGEEAILEGLLDLDLPTEEEGVGIWPSPDWGCVE